MPLPTRFAQDFIFWRFDLVEDVVDLLEVEIVVAGVMGAEATASSSIDESILLLRD